MSILIRFKKTRDCDQAIKNYNDFNYIKSKMRDIFKNICLNNENKKIKKSIRSKKYKKRVKFCDPIIKSIHFY